MIALIIQFLVVGLLSTKTPSPTTIKDLANPDFTIRENATRTLIDLDGDDVLRTIALFPHCQEEGIPERFVRAQNIVWSRLNNHCRNIQDWMENSPYIDTQRKQEDAHRREEWEAFFNGLDEQRRLDSMGRERRMMAHPR